MTINTLLLAQNWHKIRAQSWQTAKALGAWKSRWL